MMIGGIPRGPLGSATVCTPLVSRATTVCVMILYERKVSSAELKYTERRRFHVKLRKFYGGNAQIQFSARATSPVLEPTP